MPYMALTTILRKFHSKNNKNNKNKNKKNSKVTFRPYELVELAGKNTSHILKTSFFFQVNMTCPHCQCQIRTSTDSEPGPLAWILAGVLCVVG